MSQFKVVKFIINRLLVNILTNLWTHGNTYLPFLPPFTLSLVRTEIHNYRSILRHIALGLKNLICVPACTAESVLLALAERL